MNLITTEAFKNKLQAQNFLKYLDAKYPDEAKLISQRRAAYAILTSSSRFVDHLYHIGQIESKDQKQLMESIDNKIYQMKISSPDLMIQSFHEKIMFQKDLLAIFTPEEIHRYLDN